MTSQKCPHCGLINWSDAPDCKRCKAAIEPGDEATAFQPPMNFCEEKKPATVLGILMIIWGLLMLAGGLLLLTFGQVSHVLMAAAGTLISGVSVTRGRHSMALYFVGIVVMFFWATSQGQVGVAIGSLVYLGVVGLLVSRRRWPILAGFMIILSCLGFLGVVMMPFLMKPARVAWRDFRPSQGMFSVQMPADPVARDGGVEPINNGFSLKKHLYEARVKGQGSALYVVVEYMPALPEAEDTAYERALEAELSTIMTNTNSTLLFKQKTMVNGYHALSYQLSPPKNLALERPLTTGKIIMNSNYLYVMQITASQSSELYAGMNKFLTPSLLSDKQVGISQPSY
jgi:hypothetical protein